MPQVKKRLRRTQKISFCPDCGKRFANETNVLRHMNQPTNGCGSLINEQPSSYLHMPLPEEPVDSPHQSPFIPPRAPPDLFDTLQVPDDLDLPSDILDPQVFDSAVESPNVELYPGASATFAGGKTFMEAFFSDRYGSFRRDNLFYPFASREDWQLGSWLIRSGLSMAETDNFLKLDLVSTLSSIYHLHVCSLVITTTLFDQIKKLLISFRSARQLRLRAEMLPSGPSWKSLPIRPTAPTKRAVTLYYRDPVDCIQALLSNPYFDRHISFVPRKVWSTAARMVRIYDEWLSGDHAWELQVGIRSISFLLTNWYLCRVGYRQDPHY